LPLASPRIGELPISRIRELVGTHQGGTTLLGLKQGTETLGFATKAIKADPTILDELDRFELPAILYWKGYHFVVLYGHKGDKFVISDPALGVRHVEYEEMHCRGLFRLSIAAWLSIRRRI
jgi:ATP-binding cassette subfamily C protein